MDASDPSVIVAGLSRSHRFEHTPADERYVVESGEVKDCVVDLGGNEVILVSASAGAKQVHRALRKRPPYDPGHH